MKSGSAAIARAPRPSGTRPAIARSRVVFPAPFGPRMRVRPGAKSIVTSRSTGRSSKTTVTSRSDALACTGRMMGRVALACIAFAIVVVACAPEPPATDPIARGRQVYRQLGCPSCHEPNLLAQRIGPPGDGDVGAVYRDVYYRVRDDAGAADLVSDVFMRALRATGRYEPRQAFLAWLYRIARNAVIDRARRSRVQISFEDALAHPGADQVVEPDAGLLALSDKETVRQALTRLTPLQQEIIVLRFVEGYSTEEIASLVGRREGTVRGIQFRALEALRALIPSREALA